MGGYCDEWKRAGTLTYSEHVLSNQESERVAYTDCRKPLMMPFSLEVAFEPLLWCSLYQRKRFKMSTCLVAMNS